MTPAGADTTRSHIAMIASQVLLGWFDSRLVPAQQITSPKPTASFSGS
jgi:hypothetical protein